MVINWQFPLTAKLLWLHTNYLKFLKELWRLKIIQNV